MLYILHDIMILLFFGLLNAGKFFKIMRTVLQHKKKIVFHHSDKRNPLLKTGLKCKLQIKWVLSSSNPTSINHQVFNCA